MQLSRHTSKPPVEGSKLTGQQRSLIPLSSSSCSALCKHPSSRGNFLHERFISILQTSSSQQASLHTLRHKRPQPHTRFPSSAQGPHHIRDCRSPHNYAPHCAQRLLQSPNHSVPPPDSATASRLSSRTLQNRTRRGTDEKHHPPSSDLCIVCQAQVKVFP